ncbi:MAG: DUF4240 domain-containing protein [Oscillospiraceae bacterium]
MNKDLFWEIIDSVNKSFAGMDRESRRCQVVEKLLKLSLEEILDWDLILMEYSNAACRNDLWAASAALGAHYTDDGFAYFRSWLISRGKEVYMNAMRDPDSLAAVPLEGESLNYERFGYAAYEAYDAKLFRIDPDSQSTMHDAIIGRELDPKIKKEIHAELPKRKDIPEGWPAWMLPALFPNISKARAPKDIAGLLKAGNYVYGHIKKGERYVQYVFQFTPENIAYFIGSHLTAAEIVVTDDWDRLILNTIGCFIDRCPDKALLESVKKVLVPIQLGQAEAQPFFCPTRAELDAYCARKNFVV